MIDIKKFDFLINYIYIYNFIFILRMSYTTKTENLSSDDMHEIEDFSAQINQVVSL